jgi:hypothetical protein
MPAVQRKQPARCDLPVDDLVEPHGRPATVNVADRGEPVGERSEAVSVADEKVSSLHLERPIGAVSSSSKVIEHLLETPVGAGDAIVAGTVQVMFGASSCWRAVPEPPA